MRRLLLAVGVCAVLLGCADERAGGQAQRGTWSALPAAGLPRTEVAVARVGAFAYVAGGFVGVERDTGAVERFDLWRRRWQRVRSMPVALNHAAAATARGRLYIVGGYRGDAHAAALRPAARPLGLAAADADGARRSGGRRGR